MKKKLLLLTVLVMALVCLLAIVASAARVENYDAKFTLRDEEIITHYQKWQYTDNSNNYVKKRYQDTVALSFVDTNGNPLTEVPMWEYDEEEGKYYSLVWYICDYKFTWEEQTYTDDNVGEQKYPKYTSAVYTLAPVRAVDLRYNTWQENTKFTTIASWTEARSLKTLKGIYYDINNTPDDTTDDLKLQDAVGIGRDTSDYGYKGYDAQFAATGNKIVVGNFRDCDFQRDTYQNYGTSNTWSSASALQCLWYPDTMLYIDAGIGPVYEVDLGDGLEIMNCQVLRDNKRVKDFKVPNTCLYIGNEAFRGSDLTSLRLGESLITHGNDPFLYTGAADNYYISKNILNATYTGKLSQLLSTNNTSIVIYFDGNATDATALIAKLVAENSKYDGKVNTLDYKVTQDKGDLKNCVVLFYNYNRCDAFYASTHLGDDHDCTTENYCERCKETFAKQADTHSIVENLAYANGFDKAGIYNCYCDRKGCTMAGKEVRDGEKDPIIISKGYSTPENINVKGLNAGFEIKKALLDLYNELNGDASFTLFMVNSQIDGQTISKILNGETLELENGVKGVNVKISSVNYTSLSVEVRGFDDSEGGNFYTLNLITAIAVKTDDGVHYVQAKLQNSANTTVEIDGVEFNIVTANNVYNPTAQS